MRWLALFVIGGLLASVGDFTHVVTGTTEYPADYYRLYIAGLPYWVPFFFGAAAISLGVAHDRVPVSDRRPSQMRVALGLLAFVLIYIASGVLTPALGYTKDVLLAVAAVMAYVALDRTPHGAVLGIIAAIVGTSVEATMVRNGVFRYREGSNGLYGVATWLPWLYVAASAAVHAYSQRYRDRKA